MDELAILRMIGTLQQSVEKLTEKNIKLQSEVSALNDRVDTARSEIDRIHTHDIRILINKIDELDESVNAWTCERCGEKKRSDESFCGCALRPALSDINKVISNE